MTDLATITATLSAITNSIAIAKTLKNVDSTFEQSVLKLEVIKLIDLLENAQDNVKDLKNLIQEKDETIKKLEDTFKFNSSLTRQNKMYYEADEAGKSLGDPFCPRCWEVDKIPVHLKHIEELFYSCPNCKNTFGSRPKSWKSNTTSNQTYW